MSLPSRRGGGRMSTSTGTEGIATAVDGAAATLDVVDSALASDAAVVSGYADVLLVASRLFDTKSNPLTLEAYSRLCVVGSLGS